MPILDRTNISGICAVILSIRVLQPDSQPLCDWYKASISIAFHIRVLSSSNVFTSSSNALSFAVAPLSLDTGFLNVSRQSLWYCASAAWRSLTASNTRACTLCAHSSSRSSQIWRMFSLNDRFLPQSAVWQKITLLQRWGFFGSKGTHTCPQKMQCSLKLKGDS